MWPVRYIVVATVKCSTSKTVSTEAIYYSSEVGEIQPLTSTYNYLLLFLHFSHIFQQWMINLIESLTYLCVWSYVWLPLYWIRATLLTIWMISMQHLNDLECWVQSLDLLLIVLNISCTNLFGMVPSLYLVPKLLWERSLWRKKETVYWNESIIGLYK